MPLTISIKKAGLPLLFPFALTAFCLLPATRAIAGARQFIPKYVDFLADFGIEGIYEEERTTGNYGRKEQDFLMQELLGTKGLGYIYSPLFITLETYVGLGLQQERIDNNGDTSSYSDGNATRFKQVFKILPTHKSRTEL